MTNKSLVCFGLLILLSVTILVVASYNVPRQIVSAPAPVAVPQVQPETNRSPRIETRRQPDRRPIPILPYDRTSDNFGIRPFGLHRGGWEGLGWYATAFGVLLLSSVATLFIFTQRLRMMRNLLVREPRLGLWFVLLGVTGAALLGLLFTLIYLNFTTSSLLLLISPAVTLAVVMSLTVVELLLGRLVVRRLGANDSAALTDLLAGVIVLFIASSIPYVGWVVVSLAAALGFGALLYTRFGTSDEWSLESLE
jgi:hypothetical protein